jgi:hypothetical protein
LGAARLIKTEEGNTSVVLLYYFYLFFLPKIMKNANIIFYTGVNVRLSIVIKGDA